MAPDSKKPQRAPVTHLLVKSRRPSFRRAGRMFTADKWTPLKLDELEAGAEKAIREEPLLDKHDATEADVRRMVKDLETVAADPRSPAELYAAVVGLAKENEALRKEIAEIRASIRDGATVRPKGEPRLPNG